MIPIVQSLIRLKARWWKKTKTSAKDKIFHNSIATNGMSRFRSQELSILRLFTKEIMLKIYHNHFNKSVKKILVKKGRMKARLKILNYNQNTNRRIENSSKWIKILKFKIFPSISNHLLQLSSFKIHSCPLLPTKYLFLLNNPFRLRKMYKQVKASNTNKMTNIREMPLLFHHFNSYKQKIKKTINKLRVNRLKIRLSLKIIGIWNRFYKKKSESQLTYVIKVVKILSIRNAHQLSLSLMWL